MLQGCTLSFSVSPRDSFARELTFLPLLNKTSTPTTPTGSNQLYHELQVQALREIPFASL